MLLFRFLPSPSSSHVFWRQVPAHSRDPALPLFPHPRAPPLDHVTHSHKPCPGPSVPAQASPRVPAVPPSLTPSVFMSALCPMCDRGTFPYWPPAEGPWGGGHTITRRPSQWPPDTLTDGPTLPQDLYNTRPSGHLRSPLGRPGGLSFSGDRSPRPGRPESLFQPGPPAATDSPPAE